MREFAAAALPWIVIGIAVAVLLAYRGKKKGEYETCMTEGMCIGMCIGTAIGSSGILDLGLGISLGMLLGELAVMNIKK